MQAGQAEVDEGARKALATFSETYWPPLYTFVRRRGYSSADAQDIVQGFFVHLFEHNTLTRADQEKGRLRTFLLGSLQNFLLKQRERMSAIKRGGNQQLVSFDLHLPETEAAMQATAHLDQVSCYDLTWALTVAKRSWQRLHETLVAEGKTQWFDELKPFVAGAGAMPPNQEAVASRHNSKPIALHGVPIVSLTSLITADEAKDGRRVYGHRILPKPASSSELIEQVEQNRPCCAEG